MKQLKVIGNMSIKNNEDYKLIKDIINNDKKIKPVKYGNFELLYKIIREKSNDGRFIKAYDFDFFYERNNKPISTYTKILKPFKLLLKWLKNNK